MKKTILAALFLVSCNPPTQPTPNTVYVNQNQVVGSGSSDVPSSCAPVDRVRIVNFPSELGVGVSAGIDVTPKDPQGQNRSDNCNEKDGNHWTSNESVCSVSCPTCFNTTVRGLSVGTCTLMANVAGKTDSVVFPVK